MENLCVIDGDSLCYLCSKDSIEESIFSLDSLIIDICKYCNTDKYVLLLSEGKYFRHNIFENYKSKRGTYIQKLKFLKTLKNYLKEYYKAFSYPLLEADDLCAYYSKIKEYAPIICSIDKDVKYQIPCRWYDYKKQEQGVTTEKESITTLFKQCLMGDSTDGIPGIPKIGDKTSDLLLKDLNTFDEMFNKVVIEYQTFYGKVVGLKQFLINFRLVYLLRTSEDIKLEIGEFDFNPLEQVQILTLKTYKEDYDGMG